MINFREVKRLIRERYTGYISKKHPDIIDERMIISIMETSKVINTVLNISIIIIPIVLAVSKVYSSDETICVLALSVIAGICIICGTECITYANIDDMEEYMEELGDIMVREVGSLNPSMIKMIDILENLIIENRRGLSDKVSRNMNRYNTNMLRRLNAVLKRTDLGLKLPNQIVRNVNEYGSDSNGFKAYLVIRELEVLKDYTFRQPFSKKYKTIDCNNMAGVDRETFDKKIMDLYQNTVNELNKI